MAKTTKVTHEFNFEKSLDELNQIVEKLEQGGLALEDALSQFERGVMLTRQCQEALRSAEQKVEILMEKNGEFNLQPYQSEENSESE